MAQRVSQIRPEALIQSTVANVRVSQVKPEVLVTSSVAKSRVSQIRAEALIQVVVPPDTGVPSMRVDGIIGG